jgi:predicted RecA/RadA family phage recombinase
MGQFLKAQKVEKGNSVPYTPPTSNVNPGDIVLLGRVFGVSVDSIAVGTLGALDVEGIFDIAKDASRFNQGDPVYWNPTGNPLTGNAGSGCATSAGGGSTLAGYAADVLSQSTGGGGTGNSTTDTVVRTKINRNQNATSVGSTIAAAGTNQATGNTLVTGLNIVTGADGTKGVTLPVAATTIIVINQSASTLKVYPAIGAAINQLTANSNYNMSTNTSAHFEPYNAALWQTVPQVAS